MISCGEAPNTLYSTALKKHKILRDWKQQWSTRCLVFHHRRSFGTLVSIEIKLSQNCQMGKGIVVYFAPFKIPYSLLCLYSTSHIHAHIDMGTLIVTSD